MSSKNFDSEVQNQWRTGYLTVNDVSDAKALKVLVAGDVTLDWLEERIARVDRPSDRPDSQKNYQLYNPGFRWTAVWGGAALLERLVRKAVEVKCPSRFVVEPIGLPDEKSEAAREYLQSLALVGPTARDDESDPESDAPVKVVRFKGFWNSAADPAVMKIPPSSEVGPVHCIVLDDAANGCRWNNDRFLNPLKALLPTARLVVVKLSRPLDSKKLLHMLRGGEARRIVIMNADDLRAHSVDISRRLSWERSAVDIVAASSASDILRELSELGDVVIRLGSDGCVVLPRQGDKHLVFDPRGAEDEFEQQSNGKMPGATSAFVAALTAGLLDTGVQLPLLPILPSALAASRALLTRGFVRDDKKKLGYPLEVFDGTAAKDFDDVELPKRFGSADSWSILSEKLSDGSKQLPRDIAVEGYDKALKGVPITRYGKLILVDRREVEGFRSVENLLREYVDSRGDDTVRPLSLGVFGPPGSGKSFGIKQIAEQVAGSRIKPWELNLTQLQSARDLVGAFHTARDETLQGCIPLLIFDEFDCTFDGQPWGWLKYFLAPMQDGKFKDETRLHPLGDAIFVFTGGAASSYATFSEPRDSSQKDLFVKAKGPDFVSRLKGYVDILGINSEKTTDPICVARRAVLLRSLLLRQKKRTENLFPTVEPSEEGQPTRIKNLTIDNAVLDAFLTVSKYHHGARSLESILTMSRLAGRDRFAVASLPSDAQLMLHVAEDFVDILKSRVQKN